MISFQDEKELLNMAWARLSSRWEAPNKNDFYGKELVPIVDSLQKKDACICELIQKIETVRSVVDEDFYV